VVNTETFITSFAPDIWTFAHKFQQFVGAPFRADSILRAGIASMLAHQEKYILLGTIANQFEATLIEDEAELDATGFTAATRTRAFAALTETMVAELYAELGGFRKALFSIFKGVEGIQDSSNQALFKRAAQRSYGAVPADHVATEIFPELIVRLAMAYEEWFPLLSQVRTDTTHGKTGTCHRNRRTGVISYHYAKRRPLLSDDRGCNQLVKLNVRICARTH